MKNKTNTKVSDQLFQDLKRNCETIIEDEDMKRYVETFPSFDSFIFYVHQVKQNKESVFEDFFDEDLKKSPQV